MCLLVRCLLLVSLINVHLSFTDVKSQKNLICLFILIGVDAFEQSILIQFIVFIVRIALWVHLVIDFFGRRFNSLFVTKQATFFIADDLLSY